MDIDEELISFNIFLYPRFVSMVLDNRLDIVEKEIKQFNIKIKKGDDGCKSWMSETDAIAFKLKWS